MAASDRERGRLAIALVNFRSRYSLRRQVHLRVEQVPSWLQNGKWQEWTVDATHSNAWNDQTRAELTRTRTGSLEGKEFGLNATLAANSVTMIELTRND